MNNTNEQRKAEEIFTDEPQPVKSGLLGKISIPTLEQKRSPLRKPAPLTPRSW